MARRTKIIATIGPASDSEETLRDLIGAGMDVARLGLAHNTIDEAAERMARIRRIAALEGRYVGILVDLPGPKVRAASFGEEAVTIAEDSRVSLRVGDQVSTASDIEIDYAGFLADVETGDRLSMGDGRVVLEVQTLDGDRISARVAHGGILTGSPGLHIPSDRLSMRAPTDEDLVAVEHFVELGADMIAVSFVRSAEDLAKVPVEPHPAGPIVVAK
ncbi:MAG: pyruvate kinase, partial [Actinomycetota bacterium]|nr:pyruvate kinase [Actinomycetota bacterium]